MNSDIDFMLTKSVDSFSDIKIALSPKTQTILQNQQSTSSASIVKRFASCFDVKSEKHKTATIGTGKL
jgi:hypothetical protein